MRVPLLDLSQQYAALAEPIRAQVEEVLSTQNFILGPNYTEHHAAPFTSVRRCWSHSVTSAASG